MRIVISNVYGDDNRGGCALTWAALDHVYEAFPEADVAIVSVRHARDDDMAVLFRHTRNQYPAVKILPPIVRPLSGPFAGFRMGVVAMLALVGFTLRWCNAATLHACRSADFIVSRGGVIFSEPSRSANGLRMFLITLPLQIARKRRIPYVIYGAHVGRLRYRVNRLIVARVLRAGQWVYVRDAASRLNALALGAHAERLVVLPDSALALKLHSGIEVATDVLRSKGLLPGSPVIIVLSSGVHRSAQERVADALCAAISDPKRTYAVAVQCSGNEESDLPISQSFVLRNPEVALIDDDLSLSDYMALLSLAEAVVTSRLHSGLLALKMRVPTIIAGVEAHPKYRAVLAELGLEELYVDVASVGPNEFAERVARLLETTDEVREHLNRVIVKAEGRFEAVARSLRSAALGRR